jgi:hypothetical protein
VSHASAVSKYPCVVYSKGDANATPIETTSAVPFGDIIQTYKDQSQGKTNFLVFVKEGLTSSEFADNVKDFDYLKHKILNNARIYTDVVQGFQSEEFEKNIAAHKTYELKDADHLAEL